jgi:multidrug efflux system outer membrane protein
MKRLFFFWICAASIGSSTMPIPGRAGDNAGVVLPEHYTNTSSGRPSEEPYWLGFDDPALTALVERGIKGNFDIEAAKHRIVQAEAIARQTLAPLLPTVTAEAGWSLRPFDSVGTGMQVPSMQIPPTAGDTPEVIHSVSTTLKASYLVDITGRYYTARQAALLETAASKADAETQAANLALLIVQAYFDAAAAEIRLSMIKDQIASSEELLGLVEARFRTGASNALDVLQQRQLLEATKSQLPLVRALIDTSRQQLAALIGESSTSSLPAIRAELPNVGELPAAGSPGRLHTARPELRAAKERLEALNEREKSALRTLLPSLALNGQVGYQMIYSNEVYDGDLWSLGVLLSIPLYQGGANWAALDQARAAKRAATSALQQGALNAYQQVESSMINERERRDRLEILHRQMKAAELTFTEARKRYLVGLSEYLNVLAALGSYQAVELSVLQAERDLLFARIQLLSALGGDWTRQLLSGRGGK